MWLKGNKLFLVLWHLLLRRGFLLPKEKAWKFQVNPIQIMLQLLLCNCNSTALIMYVVKCTCMLSITQPVVQRLDNVLPDWHITWNIWAFNSKQLFKPWRKVKTNMADQDKKASAVYNELHIHALRLHNNTLESNSSEQIMLTGVGATRLECGLHPRTLWWIKTFQLMVFLFSSHVNLTLNWQHLKKLDFDRSN